jgi:hypothetical protein
MGYERIKTEHAGAKNGGGAWMTRAEAKRVSKRKRRQADKACEAYRDNRTGSVLSWLMNSDCTNAGLPASSIAG